MYRRQESRPPPPQEKEMQKKSKMDVRGALQIAVKRMEAESKGEKERDTHLKAEFERIASRDKKAFLNTGASTPPPSSLKKQPLQLGAGL